MNLTEAKDLIARCYEEKTAHVFKKATENTPSWENFIAHLDYEFNQEESQVSNKPLEETMIGGVCLRNHFYMSVRNPRWFGYSYLDDFIDFWDGVFETPGLAVSAFINFVGNEEPIMLHTDRRDSLYWQCQGTVEWQVTSDENGPVTSYFLEPGDAIFVPKGVYHSVVTTNPRAAITLAYNADPYKVYYDTM